MEAVHGGTSGYQHDSTMNYIDELMDDSNNKGILLYVDSPEELSMNPKNCIRN